MSPLALPDAPVFAVDSFLLLAAACLVGFCEPYVKERLPGPSLTSQGQNSKKRGKVNRVKQFFSKNFVQEWREVITNCVKITHDTILYQRLSAHQPGVSEDRLFCPGVMGTERRCLEWLDKLSGLVVVSHRCDGIYTDFPLLPTDR